MKKCKVRGCTLAYQYLDCPNIQIHSDIEGPADKIGGVMVLRWLTADDKKNTGNHTINISVACEWKVEPIEANTRNVSGPIPCYALIVTNCRIRITARSYLQRCKL